jgi:tRNA (guanine37-N1)-methyltransferase
LRNTYLKRPDLLQDREFGPEDQQLLNEVMQESLVHVPVR